MMGAPVGAAQRRRKVLLRLDDGSLIGPSSSFGGSTAEPVRLPVEKALQLHRISEKDVARLERLLCTAQQLGVAPPRSTVHQVDTHVAKKARVDSGPGAGGGQTFLPKCMEILRRIFVELGVSKDVFYKPVDPNLIKDYYTIVKDPITLGQIEDRIKRKVYISSEQFYNDVRLVWANCKLYNPVGDPFRALGEKMERSFERHWASSGLPPQDERAKRATAGVAAPKYEPEPLEGAGGARPKTSSAARSTGGKKPAGGRNNEVTSGGGPSGRVPRPLSEERRAEIATQLSELGEEHMEGLMGLLPPHMLEGAEGGEFELDFEALDDGTLRKIDAFLRAIHAGVGTGLDAPPAAARPPGRGASTARIDPDTSEGEEEDDDDSDADSD